jgi:hypothetical protein
VPPKRASQRTTPIQNLMNQRARLVQILRVAVPLAGLQTAGKCKGNGSRRMVWLLAHATSEFPVTLAAMVRSAFFSTFPGQGFVWGPT